LATIKYSDCGHTDDLQDDYKIKAPCKYDKIRNLSNLLDHYMDVHYVSKYFILNDGGPMSRVYPDNNNNNNDDNKEKLANYNLWTTPGQAARRGRR